MLLQLVQTGRYDLPGGTQIRDSMMTSVRTWNELIRKVQSMEYEEGWDRIDHSIPLNPVQAQPHQPALSQKQWRSSPPTSPPSFLRPSSQKSFFVTETSAPATVQSPSHQEKFKQPGKILRDPTWDLYHSTTDQSMKRIKKTMPTKSCNAKFKQARQTSLQSIGMGGVIKIKGVNIL